MSYNATKYLFFVVVFLHLLKKGIFFFFFFKYNTVRSAATEE